MLVKEYRIPLPLTVEEYKIAQLYMIAKASKLETQGAGSGVEFLVNEPYVDGPGGQGQYTHKIYHVADHLPGWLKAILPRFVSGAVVDEEGWNAYPYTKTRYSCQSIEKFFIELETLYFDDNGYQENVFNLDEKDLKNRTVDVIDIVKDQLPKNDYKEEEDPTIYVSKKTNRGPLSRDWVEEYWEAMQKKDSNKRIMCAYKLAKVEFKYWGMQSKLEKFIHDFVLRKTMLKGHRQAWVWQDEWLDLTMDDIRRMEREIQEQLAQKMAEISGEGAKSEASITEKSSSLTSSRQSCDLDLIDKDKDEEIKNMSMELPRKSPSSLNETRKIISKLSDQASDEQLGANRLRKSSIRKNSKAELYSPGGTCIQNFDVQFASWRMESIANDDGSSSNEEFYDAEEILENETLSKWSSLECVSPDYGEPEATKEDELPGNDDSIFSSSFIHKTQIEHSRKNILSMMARGSVEASAPSSPTASPGHSTTCMTNFLIIVVHGGNILESGAEPLSSKKSDLTTFRVTFESIIRLHYPSLNGKIVFKLVPAPAICADALAVLSSLSPYSFQSSPSAIDGICHSYEAMPIGSLPLFAISSQEYQENVSKVIAAANQVHQEFLRSEEGLGFNGHVVLIGDSVGSILAYDALCRSQLNRSNCGSENSINDIGDITGSNSGANSRPKSVSPANLNLHKNPLISISDGSGGEECDDGVARGNSPIGGKSSGTPASNQTIPNQRKGKISKTRFHHSFGENEENLHLYLKILSVPNSRRRSSSSSDQSITQKFDFDVSDFFMFGSPLSLMLTFRKMLSLEEKNFSFNKPCCNQVYNLFHPTDPSVLRLEPLLSARFSHIPPINVPKYSKHPMVDEFANNLAECIRHYNHVFSDNNSTGNHNIPSSIRRPSETPTVSSNNENVMGCPLVQSLVHKWWGTKRLDYALYCPEGLTNFPVHSLPHLFHASYWESNDVILFILKQLVQSDPSAAFEGKEAIVFVPNQEKEKWVKKRTSMKLKNITANHRANDVIVKEGSDQIISARFMYGPLDVFTLTGEKVDIHMMKDSSGEWSYLSTETTDKTGRITYTIPQDKTLDFGIYPFKLIVRGDHSSIDFFLAVVPPRTECVVFSIDGSFTASVSVSGKDPKVRAGAVDVVRHWQDLGYLIIYITGRPDMQQHRVISWLAQHNFPFGLVSFADRLSTDALKHKADYLKHLQQETEIVIHAAYGSSKDIWVYETIGLKPEQIYVVGKVSKKQQSHAKVLNDGYAAHLAELLTPGGSRPAIGNARMVLPRGGFGMGTASGISFRTRQSAKKTSSFPLPADTNTSGLGSPIVTGNAGRTQSASQQEQGTFSNFFTYHRSGSNKSK